MALLWIQRGHTLRCMPMQGVHLCKHRHGHRPGACFVIAPGSVLSIVQPANLRGIAVQEVEVGLEALILFFNLVGIDIV